MSLNSDESENAIKSLSKYDDPRIINMVLEAQEKYNNLVKQFGVPLEDSLPEFGYPKAESNQG